MKTKSEFRRELIARRMSLSDKEVTQKSKAILRTVMDLVDWPLIKRVHVYNANHLWNEVETAALVDFIEKEWPKVQIYSSTVSPFSILPNRQFDVTIVPLVGFDEGNYRLGLGAGWYDRFLASQPVAKKIGLAYECSRVPHLPFESHDVALDVVVTESNVYGE